MSDNSFEQLYLTALTVDTCPSHLDGYMKDVFETMHQWQRTYIKGEEATPPYQGEYITKFEPLEIPKEIVEAVSNIRYLEPTFQFFEIKHQYGIWIQFLNSGKRLNLPTSLSILTFFYLTSYLAFRDVAIERGKKQGERDALHKQMWDDMLSDPFHIKALSDIRARYVIGKDYHGQTVDLNPIKALLREWFEDKHDNPERIPTKVEGTLIQLGQTLTGPSLTKWREPYEDKGRFSQDRELVQPLLERLSLIAGLSGPYASTEFKRQSLSDQILILVFEVCFIASLWESIVGYKPTTLGNGVFLDMVRTHYEPLLNSTPLNVIAKLIKANDDALFSAKGM